MQGVDFLQCVLKLIHWVDLKAEHIATTLQTKVFVYYSHLYYYKYYIIILWTVQLTVTQMADFTWRELSITKAKPNFESLILIDHLRGKDKSNEKKYSIQLKEKSHMILQQKQDNLLHIMCKGTVVSAYDLSWSTSIKNTPVKTKRAAGAQSCWDESQNKWKQDRKPQRDLMPPAVWTLHQPKSSSHYNCVFVVVPFGVI